jgi:hypothetical protein
VLRSDLAKDAELLVVRHENAVMPPRAGQPRRAAVRTQAKQRPVGIEEEPASSGPGRDELFALSLDVAFETDLYLIAVRVFGWLVLLGLRVPRLPSEPLAFTVQR